MYDSDIHSVQSAALQTNGAWDIPAGGAFLGKSNPHAHVLGMVTSLGRLRIY